MLDVSTNEPPQNEFEGPRWEPGPTASSRVRGIAKALKALFPVAELFQAAMNMPEDEYHLLSQMIVQCFERPTELIERSSSSSKDLGGNLTRQFIVFPDLCYSEITLMTNSSGECWIEGFNVYTR